VRQRWSLADLRTTAAGVDPGLVRLRLASIGTASMALAAGVMSGVAALTGQPVTVVLFAAVLAMISNLSVNEPDPRRLRVTTALMLAPAAASITLGTLLAPHHVVATTVFVVVMMIAVYVRRFGPRGFALGMAGFMSYFFTQFLQATLAQLPWLMLGAAVGIGSTLLLRGVLLPERPERTLARQLRAFRAHLHGLVRAVAALLTAEDTDDRDEARRDVQRRRARLNDTALLVADALDRRRAAAQEEDADAAATSSDEDRRPTGGDDSTLGMSVLDAELAAERLTVTTWRLVQADPPVDDDTRRALLDGLHGLGAATATGTPPSMVRALLDCARRSVGTIAEERCGHWDRAQRVAFAVTRLADAQDGIDRPAEPAPAAGRAAEPDGNRAEPAADDPAPEPDDPDKGRDDEDGDAKAGLLLTTRQAIQVGVATSLAIIAGELISPARWYWAVITAFVVFAGTNSRGDVLSRGAQRILGTIGGVLAGMVLAVLVSGQYLAALLLLFTCVFLALYLVRVSPALMAFWITAVLALLYGLIGEFSVETLVLRIEETAVGAVIGMLAGYLVLPKRTREAFDEALDEMVDAADAVLAAGVDTIRGRPADPPPAELAHTLHDALATLRMRAAPLDSPLPWRHGRSSYQRTLRVLTAVDYYARSLARLSDTVHAPGWESLDLAADRVRANLDAVRQVLRGHEGSPIRSAELLVDAAEADASHLAAPEHRARLLGVARVLRRIDQAVVALAADLGRADVTTEQVHPDVGTRPAA
jgi:uncharacterized membrane protein YgaE (UPF0421/DUF939 family)